MHKNFKGAIAKALIATLAISLAGVQAPESAAAKKPKLSAKKVSVGVKKSKKISIKNVKAKEIKKLDDVIAGNVSADEVVLSKAQEDTLAKRKNAEKYAKRLLTFSALDTFI